ncbi:hypothetical protein PsorP6_000540 [Peronosclerospora sorghi]|uniref:Uncharacterized protein n=1 Tax=Peronosclerospora sorghi TaxID=230839 RepID=A0ACC0WTD4_9STRA|nr:hypothetical protein PsorP6_000540 [Peronosclerospora sorghi]
MRNDRVVVAKQELDLVKSKESSLADQYREARSKAEEASGAMQSHATRSRMLRELLDASKPGIPLENAGLYGRLGDLGAIDSKYDVAISTACGALNNLVVETTSGAQPCVTHLRKHNLGRTTFLILEQLGYLKSKYSQHFPSVRALSGKETPSLFDLVKVNNEDKYLLAFYYSLRKTLVTKDMDEASANAYQGRQCKYRVVTLDGQLKNKSLLEKHKKGLQGERQEEPEPPSEQKAEDTGLEMQNDFEGTMHDMPDDEEGEQNESEHREELDREMGDFDQNDENVVDEKLWGEDSDDDENRIEEEKLKFEENSEVKG